MSSRNRQSTGALLAIWAFGSLAHAGGEFVEPCPNRFSELNACRLSAIEELLWPPGERTGDESLLMTFRLYDDPEWMLILAPSESGGRVELRRLTESVAGLGVEDYCDSAKLRSAGIAVENDERSVDAELMERTTLVLSRAVALALELGKTPREVEVEEESFLIIPSAATFLVAAKPPGGRHACATMVEAEAIEITPLLMEIRDLLRQLVLAQPERESAVRVELQEALSRLEGYLDKSEVRHGR